MAKVKQGHEGSRFIGMLSSGFVKKTYGEMTDAELQEAFDLNPQRMAKYIDAQPSKPSNVAKTDNNPGEAAPKAPAAPPAKP